MFLLGLILSGFLDFWTTSSPIETFDNFPEQDFGEIQIYVFSARSTGQVAMDLSTYLPTYLHTCSPVYFVFLFTTPRRKLPPQSPTLTSNSTLVPNLTTIPNAQRKLSPHFCI